MAQAVLALALGGLGRDALKVAAGIALAIFLALAFAVSSVAGLVGVGAPGQPSTSAAASEIPPDQLVVMQQAAAASCGLPWTVLAGIAKVESDFGHNMATSSAGAIGYGQFLPATWATYGQGNPYDYHDALPAIARYLCANGAPGGLHAAIWAYNHADWYVAEVLALAARYGSSIPAEPTSRVVALAQAELGMPYVWGGASPATSFDCSGLVQWVYGQVGITLPRTAQEQFDATVRITPDQLQPGDLVFFAHTYPSADPITHVGIYVGNGTMINAPEVGEVVQEMPVFTGYWGAHYAGAGRVQP